jgi:predicted nucleotidyltransferase
MNTEEVFRRLRALKPRFEEMKIKRMAVFGSHARGDARPDSDVDVLIEPNGVFTLFDMVDVKNRLEAELHCNVDVVTFRGLQRNPRFSYAQEEATDV